jgi:hypothetical protein
MGGDQRQSRTISFAAVLEIVHAYVLDIGSGSEASGRIYHPQCTPAVRDTKF